MKLISWNVNGIRACLQKGFLDFLKKENPDILCVQEIKAGEQDLNKETFNSLGYNVICNSAERRGYSGTASFIKHKPKNIKTIFSFDYYKEGRVIETEYNNFILFNVYFPNGQRDLERLQYKLDFYKDFFNYCNELKAKGKNIIVCGDFNTAHKEIDLANPKANEKYSGFLPEERAWLDKIVDDFNYVDTFREFHKEPEQYSWWTYRFGARKKNIGWRLDYFFVNKEFISHVKDAYIMQDVMGSDHCPVGLELR